MMGAVSKYDFLFCPLKVADNELGYTLKNQLEEFLASIKNDLFSDTHLLKSIINKRLPDIFELRLAALRWLKREGNPNLIELLTNDAHLFFEKIKDTKRLYMLATHVVEALDSNKKIIASMKTRGAGLTDSTFDIPDISFEQFVDTVYFSNPNQEDVAVLIDFTKCSLYIEYITLAAFIISAENLLVSDNRIIELSATLAETIQAYVSLAASLQLIVDDEKPANKQKANPRGAAIFSKMLKDKKFISEHLRNGGELSDLKDQFNFVNPLHFTAQ